MRVAHGRADRPTERRTDTFSGGVWGDLVLPAEDGIVVNTVTFEPGARTYWHQHEIAQVLFVTHGEGRLQSADGTGATLRPGDVAHIPAGEVHWHGAAPGSILVHVAVSVGKTEWMNEVSEEDYASAFTD
ncbi:MAG TPA: cupin domain-containing protein [Solirubrobacterales bacterium]|nr:cupin domain-containing protein [Solirubrobacterales bacterium]